MRYRWPKKVHIYLWTTLVRLWDRLKILIGFYCNFFLQFWLFDVKISCSFFYSLSSSRLLLKMVFLLSSLLFSSLIILSLLLPFDVWCLWLSAAPAVSSGSAAWPPSPSPDSPPPPSTGPTLVPSSHPTNTQQQQHTSHTRQ